LKVGYKYHTQVPQCYKVQTEADVSPGQKHTTSTKIVRLRL